MDVPLLYTNFATWYDGSPSRIKKPAPKPSLEKEGRTLDTVTLETLKTLYTRFPVSAAAQHLGVGLTVFKRRCRQLGVARWPHRRVRSMFCNA